MANLSIAYADYQVFLQKKSGKRLRNRLWPIMPVAYLLFGLTGGKADAFGLGAPNTSTNVLVSKTKTANATKEQMFSAQVKYRPTIQYKKPNAADGSTIGQYSSMPVRTDGAAKTPASYFIQPEFAFHEHADPYEIPNDQLETIQTNETGGWPAEATLAIGSIMDAEIKSVEATHLEYWSDMLWGITSRGYTGPGYPSDQTSVKWDSLHSLQYSIGTTTNNYGGLDRTVTPTNDFWVPKTASTPKIVFKDFVRTLNYNSSYRFADVGAGVDIIAVDGAGFQQALNEVDGKTIRMVQNGLPSMGDMGFKDDIVCINNKTYVVYDPRCPAGHIAALNSSTWTFAIHGKKNFKVSTPTDQTINKGGDDVTCGTVRTKMLWCCEEPAYNFYATGATY